MLKSNNRLRVVLICFGILFTNELLAGNHLRSPAGSTGDGQQTPGQSDFLKDEKDKFEKDWRRLTDKEQGLIKDSCGLSLTVVKNIRNETDLRNHYTTCGNNFGYDPYRRFSRLNSELGVGEKGLQRPVENYDKIFPKHKIKTLSEQADGIYQRHNSYCRTQRSHPGDPRGEQLIQQTKCAEYNLAFLSAGAVNFLENAATKDFVKDRAELMDFYKCDTKRHLSDCLAERAGEDRKCLEKAGFKKCRPFLECNREQRRVSDIGKLSAELNRENKDGMAYICWKAATQGAQCCMNPDQCPTDGAFRNIAGQLKQAGPGLIRQFAGLKAITGQNQAACRANLMANAAGPLAGLRTKTCNDSSKACEETCDEKVQDFKARLKQALAGDRAKEVNIDELVSTAEELHDGEDIPDEEGEIKTCSLMLVKLNRDFKKRKEDTKLRGLTEQLSHASIVDCSEEVEKYAFHRRRGGSSGPGGGISPLASRMCRNAAGGFIPPKGPFAGVTPNPNLGSAHLLGGKTVPGKGASGPYFGGPGGLPEEEFIEPERGVSGAGHLSGGWTGSQGDSSGGSPGGGPGGGLSQSPSEDGPGSEEELDTLSPSVPEGFDLGGGGSESGVSGEDMSPEDLRRLELAKKMEEMETKKLMKETPREHFGPPDENIFDRVSRAVRAWCKKEGCLD